MNYLFAAFAAFWIIKLAQVWIDIPGWAWQLIQVAVATVFLLPWDQTLEWYGPFAVAGIVSFLQMTENLLIAKSDEALSAIMRRR